MPAGTELLFLSGGAGSVSDRFAAGRAWQQEVSFFVLYGRTAASVRLSVRASDLRMAVSVWPCTRRYIPDPFFSETKKLPGAPGADLAEICDFGLVCHTAAAARG